MPRRETTDQGEAAPSRTLRSQHVEATRRAVLTAARAAFGTKGYAQTSVDEIAAAAGVTKGAVYHHFSGKEALFRAVWAEVEADATARAASAGDPDSPPIEQLVAEVDAYLEVALDEEVRQITLIDGPVVLGLEPEGPVEQHPGHLALRAFIGAAISRGELRDLDPGIFAHLVGGLALLGGLMIARATTPLWSPTTPPAACSCCRWPADIRHWDASAGSS